MKKRRRMLIFLDTEFTSFENRQLISIGLVSLCGQHKFYREISDFDKRICSPFTLQFVLPLLGDNANAIMPKHQVRDELAEWLQQFKSVKEVVIAVDYDGDWFLFCDLLEEVPEFVMRANIRALINDAALEQFFRDNNLKQHHAMNDAIANRHIFLKL